MALAMPPKQAAAIAEFENKYESLKDALRSFKRDDFLLGLIKIIRDHEGIPFEEYAKGKPLPWTMLTLIKLACEHCGKNAVLKKANYNDFVETYRKAYDLEEAYTTAILLGNMICFFLFIGSASVLAPSWLTFRNCCKVKLFFLLRKIQT